MMENDLYNFVQIAGVLSMALIVIALAGLIMGNYKARRDFREKGFLRPPQGVAWLRFLFLKQYEWFKEPSIRFYFGASHICLIALLVIIAAVLVYTGSEFMLKGMDMFTFGTPGHP